MKNSILFIILSFSLLSCQHKGDSTKNSTIETIPVFSNYTAELPFSAFVDTIELIPLETTEDNLIGEITRVIFNNGKYYIRSTNGMQNPKLFVFNENGKYIHKALDRENISISKTLPLQMMIISSLQIINNYYILIQKVNFCILPRVNFLGLKVILHYLKYYQQKITPIWEFLFSLKSTCL